MPVTKPSKNEIEPPAAARAGKPSKRSSTGSTFGLIAVGALLIIMAIVAAFKLNVFLGSSQEMKNSVDAGALNVAEKIFQIKVYPDEIDANGGYSDVCDSQHSVGLANINRVWAKAFLINANAQSMAQQGYGAGGNSPGLAMQGAMQIHEQLYKMLTNKAAIYVYFNQLTSGKPAKLLGQKGSVEASDTDDWATACLYRGEESNIQVLDPLTIPPGVTANLYTKYNQSYLQGYNPSTANDSRFCFVTFHANEAPHLIANSIFEQWQNATIPGAGVIPLPNAFKESGVVAGPPSFSAAASAVANPMRTFPLTIPHSYVMVTLQSILTCRLDDGHGHKTMFEPQPYYADTPTITAFKNVNLETAKYNYPESLTSWLRVTGLFSGYVSVGNELKPATLWQAINALPGDHSAALNLLLQRVKEFKPGYSMGDLRTLLQGQSLLATNGSTTPATFYIYPTYSTPDLTDPKVIVSATNLPGWLRPPQPEGFVKPVVYETTTKDKPNYCWSNILEGRYEIPNKPKPQWPNYSTDAHRTTVSGTLSWQPGTGWQQCLGILSISRHTDVIFTGWPPVSDSFLDQIFGAVGTN